MWQHSCSKAELCFSVCELYSSETTTYTLSQRESLRFSLCVIFIVCFVISSTLFHRSRPQWCLPLWSVFCMIVSVTVSLSSSFAPVLQSHHLCVSVFSYFCNRLSVLIFFSGLGYCLVVLGSGPGCSCPPILLPGSGGPPRWKCMLAGGGLVCVLWHNTVAPIGLPHWLAAVTCMRLCSSATANQRKAWV